MNRSSTFASPIAAAAAWTALALSSAIGCREQNHDDAAAPGAVRATATPTFMRRLDCYDSPSVWLKIDTHVHSHRTDGNESIESLVEAASKFGCNAVAITDHADRGLEGASEVYFADIRRARQQFPKMIVLAGLEWNIPPHGGDEHVTVIVEPTPDEAVILAEFKERFDDFNRDPLPEEAAEEGLRWLTDRCASADALAIVCYNHPSRKRNELTSFPEEFKKLRKASPLLIGFEGTPGHQGGLPVGAYDGPIQLEDRWDPLVAVVGGAWDGLLQQGVDSWAAVAGSDFHRKSPKGWSDYFPGEFSETWVYASEATPRGLLLALQRGSFFGAHGHIVRQVQLTVAAEGLPRPAQAGESISVKTGARCDVAVQVEIPARDWKDDANSIDSIELIAIDSQGARVAATFDDVTSGKKNRIEMKNPAGGMVIRARGRRELPDLPDMLFMTNPIRIVAASAAEK